METSHRRHGGNTITTELGQLIAAIHSLPRAMVMDADLPAYSSEHGSLLMMQAFLYGIGALVVIAFLTVWSIQRTREVAILRALGASRGWVLRDALAQSAAVLLGGTALGLVLGGLGLSVFALSLGVLGTVFIDRYRSLAAFFTGGAVG